MTSTLIHTYNEPTIMLQGQYHPSLMVSSFEREREEKIIIWDFASILIFAKIYVANVFEHY